MPAQQEPERLTITEAAQRYKVNERTIRRWIATGQLNAERLGARTVRVLVAPSEVRS